MSRRVRWRDKRRVRAARTIEIRGDAAAQPGPRRNGRGAAAPPRARPRRYRCDEDATRTVKISYGAPGIYGNLECKTACVKDSPDTPDSPTDLAARLNQDAPDAVRVEVSTLVAVTFLSAIALGFIAVRLCRRAKKSGETKLLLVEKELEETA